MFAYGDMQICSVKFNALQRVWKDMTIWHGTVLKIWTKSVPLFF